VPAVRRARVAGTSSTPSNMRARFPDIKAPPTLSVKATKTCALSAAIGSFRYHAAADRTPAAISTIRLPSLLRSHPPFVRFARARAAQCDSRPPVAGPPKRGSLGAAIDGLVAGNAPSHLPLRGRCRVVVARRWAKSRQWPPTWQRASELLAFR
jgi:hypothetical protein